MRIRTLAPFALALSIACGGAEMEEAATEEMTEAMDDAPAMVDADAAMATITDYWQTHYNMGHGSMVASKFVEDGVLWGSSGAMLYGREAIGEGLQSRMDAGSSEIAIHPGAAMGFGDQVVARGHYVLTGGDARNSGYYIGVAENADGEWALKGMVANLDTPDQTMSAGAMMDMPEGMGGDLVQESSDYFVTHYNMGHASMVANTFTEDAVAMLPGERAREGRAAVEEGLQALFDAGVMFSGMSTWSAHDLDEGHAVGIGTYGTEDGSGGHYAALYSRGDDGSLMLHWFLMGAHQGM
ncbi:hypothetical protein [Candidatus Palauibacter sp.]|uniref:hypothetical protein n=1 Tax=Candidatus Palauibacter sp. TaxID=3101350 RepID=UPI003B01EEA3